ncbi:hypothetical protein D8S78_09945 [Natrialba swarupiae]|nr:hypothetical protein [Natrialba swarupiae]
MAASRPTPIRRPSPPRRPAGRQCRRHSSSSHPLRNRSTWGRPSRALQPTRAPNEAEFVVGRGATRRHLRLTSTPVRGVGDDLLGRSIVVRDVTETRRLQAEVEETLERLRRSNAELESFAGVVSHDLREPLRTIEQSLSIVEPNADELDPEHAEFVRVARENAQRAQRMIADLLAYSKIERETNEFGPSTATVSSRKSSMGSGSRSTTGTRRSTSTSCRRFTGSTTCFDDSSRTCLRTHSSTAATSLRRSRSRGTKWIYLGVYRPGFGRRNRSRVCRSGVRSLRTR